VMMTRLELLAAAAAAAAVQTGADALCQSQLMAEVLRGVGEKTEIALSSSRSCGSVCSRIRDAEAKTQPKQKRLSLPLVPKNCEKIL